MVGTTLSPLGALDEPTGQEMSAFCQVSQGFQAKPQRVGGPSHP